jgi:polar amino acid transport system substrate-binding protein
MAIKNRKIWFQTVFFVSVIIFLGCATTGNEEPVTQPIVPQENILQVGVTPTFPPTIFYENDRVVGLEADFANALAESMGKKARFVILGWKDLIPALLEKRIDIIMSGMSITEMRKTRINFTSPYLSVGQMALVRMADLQFFPTADSIKKTQSRVGFVQGTTGEFLVEQEFPLTNRKIPFPSTNRAVQALSEERIDIFIGGAPGIWWKAATQEKAGLARIPILLTEEQYAWGIRKDDTEMLNSANLFLETWKGDGRLKRAITKWMPPVPDERIPD